MKLLDVLHVVASQTLLPLYMCVVHIYPPGSAVSLIHVTYCTMCAGLSLAATKGAHRAVNVVNGWQLECCALGLHWCCNGTWCMHTAWSCCCTLPFCHVLQLCFQGHQLITLGPQAAKFAGLRRGHSRWHNLRLRLSLSRHGSVWKCLFGLTIISAIISLAK